MSLTAQVGLRERGDRVLQQVVSAAVVLFPAACLLVNRADSVILALLALIGLWVALRGGFKDCVSQADWRLFAAFAVFFSVGVLAFEFGDHTNAGFRILGRYFRLLCVLPAIIALKRYRVAPFAVWAGLGLGSAVLGVDAILEWWGSGGLARAAGNTDVAILFGDLATLTVFAFVSGHTYIDKRWPRLGPVLLALATLLGLTASLLSGARGAWLAVPVLLVILLLSGHILRTRTVLIGIAALTALCTVLYFLPQTQVRERVSDAAAQMRDYYQVTDGLSRVDGGRRCMDQRGVLRAWISVAERPAGVDIFAVQELGRRARALAAAGCSTGVTVRIRNSAANPVSVDWPRTQRDSSGTATTHFMVRGSGSAMFYAYNPSARDFSSDNYAAISVSAPADHGGSVLFTVPPHAILSLVPVEAFAGEYRYPLVRTPIGQRLEMWRAALRIFAAHPFLGVGTGGYQEATRRLVAGGEVAPDTSQFDHPHNDYFDALANRGVLGFVALLMLLGVPAWEFGRALRGPGTQRMTAGLAGLLVVIGYAIFGLTETLFIHSATITWYAMMTALFFALANTTEK